jgi:phage terminase large subunit
MSAGLAYTTELPEAPPDLGGKVPPAFGFLYFRGTVKKFPVRHRAAFGGRGSAKSHSFAQALVTKGIMRPGLRVLCAREIQKSIKDSVKRLLDDKIEALGLGKYYESTDTEIRGPGGTLFVFAGLRSNVQSVKSLEGIDIAWVEEASSVSQHSINTLTPTLRKPGSEAWWSWNPDKATDPVDVMFRGPGGPPPGSIVRRINWDDNPWFPVELQREMEWDQVRDPDKYAHIWLGEYQKNSESRVFRNWRVEAFETPDNVTFYWGADWGFSVDPSVLVRCYINEAKRTLYVDAEVYGLNIPIDQTPDFFRKAPDGVKNWRPGDWVITADSARPETIDYMQRHGFPRMQAARKGAGSIEEGINFLKNYDIVVHPRCRHTRDELTLYSYKIDPKTEQVLPILEDKKNHVIDALRYAVETLRRGGRIMVSTVRGLG